MKFHIASHIHAFPAALFRAPCLFSWCEHFLAFVRRFGLLCIFRELCIKNPQKQRFTLYIAIHILHLFFRTVHAFFVQKNSCFPHKFHFLYFCDCALSPSRPEKSCCKFLYKFDGTLAYSFN